MTTTTKVSAPVDIDVAMARLILLRERHGLPRPTAYKIDYACSNRSSDRIDVRVATPGDMAAWADALGIPQISRHVSRYEDRSEIHGAWLGGWHGWRVSLTAYVEPSGAVSADLDADAVAALEVVAVRP